MLTATKVAAVLWQILPAWIRSSVNFPWLSSFFLSDSDKIFWSFIASFDIKLSTLLTNHCWMQRCSLYFLATNSISCPHIVFKMNISNWHIATNHSLSQKLPANVYMWHNVLPAAAERHANEGSIGQSHFAEFCELLLLLVYSALAMSLCDIRIVTILHNFIWECDIFGCVMLHLRVVIFMGVCVRISVRV